MNRGIMTVAHPPRSPAPFTYSRRRSTAEPSTSGAPAARPHPDEQFVSADHLWHEIAAVVRTALSRSARAVDAAAGAGQAPAWCNTC